VRYIGDRAEDGQALGRDAETAITKDLTRVGVHCLDPIQKWNELQSGLDTASTGVTPGPIRTFPCMDRESHAFEALFDGHYAAVCRYIAARASRDVVEDVAAETFLVAWRRRDRLPREPLGWLLATAANCLANQQRASQRAARLSQKAAALTAPVSASVEEALKQHAQGRALFGALAAMRPADRELLLLHHWDGLAPREIATVIGSTAVVARARLHRAGRRLQRALGDALEHDAARPTSAELNSTA
jgi:RNA polymerase sigma factor (sigma-70 family)